MSSPFSGLAVFDLIRGHGPNARAVLYAFDLLEVIRRSMCQPAK